MSRSISTTIALSLGIAVSAVVAFSVFAQRNQAASAVSPESASVQAPQAAPAAPAPSAPAAEAAPAEKESRSSIRSGSLSISASGKTNPVTIKEEKPPEIEVDSTNIREIAKSSVQPIRESKKELTLTSKLPDSALAARIMGGEKDTVLVWRPAFASQGFRGTRLDAFAVSQDGSVLAIAERTGTFNGPNGTRIVLINTSDWQVIRIVTTDRMLKKLAFVPDSDTLAAVAYPQQALGQAFGILRIDLKNDDSTDFVELPFPFNENIDPGRVALLATPAGIFCSGFFDTKVFFLPHAVPENAALPYSTFETVAPASALAITPDGKALAAASLKAIEYFELERLRANMTRRQSITTLDLGWAPVDLHFLAGAGTDFIVCPAYREDSPPVIFRSSVKESLDGRSAGFAIPMESGTQIGVAFKVKGRIDIIEPATLEAADSVILEQLRPATNGDVVFAFYLDSIHAFCVIDSSGNCFAAGKKEGDKRWAKRIIWNGAGKR